MKSKMHEVRVGIKATGFALPDETGRIHDLESYQKKSNVVLIFYPGDDTPGCIMQLCAVRDDWQEFVERNALVLGVNHADAASHRRFIEKYNLKNHLLVDEGRRVAKLYGAIGSFLGHETTKRTVVIVDKRGVVQYFKYGLPPNGELFEVLDWVNGKGLGVRS